MPTLSAKPPFGTRWVHEVKFDGYRVQVHKNGAAVTIYSRNGTDFTSRFIAVAEALKAAKGTFIIDGEMVVNDTQGHPDFTRLHRRQFKQDELCLWAFDLLAIGDADFRESPLAIRKARLATLVQRADTGFMRFSESFKDAASLLHHCEKLALEGIVSKVQTAPYKSGKGDWLKIKTAAWKLANKDRGELFKKID